MIKIFTDAATNPQLKKSGGGIVIIKDQEQIQLNYILTAGSNHEAELEIILKALDYLIEKDWRNDSILLYSDSKTAIKILDQNSTKNNLFLSYLKEFNQKSPLFSLLVLQWIPESKNKGADHLARQGLQKALKNR
ncbi:reverse transcriptase-like protein [Enterococcus sp. AZ103]|uniref:reverse transcriptase-like protein n=1 Tax=Enterococcus sp. AZ103 TaxID=2774628 RepID=UPI003F1EA607